MAPGSTNSDEAKAKAAEWVADLERAAAEGALWEGPPVADQLADHFARLGVSDPTKQELERRARRVLSGEAAGEVWAVVRQRVADELAD